MYVFSPAARQHACDYVAQVVDGRMHWSMQSFARVCCSLMPMSSFHFSSFSFTLSAFSHPCIPQAPAREKERLLQSYILLECSRPVREKRCFVGGVPSGGWGTRHKVGTLTFWSEEDRRSGCFVRGVVDTAGVGGVGVRG